jgi:hypothetical protein
METPIAAAVAAPSAVYTGAKREELMSLLHAKKQIDRVLSENRVLLQSLRQERLSDTNSILSFANNITQTIRAPVDWAPGLPLCGHPPAPLLEQMRAGVLQKYNLQFVVVEQSEQIKESNEPTTAEIAATGLTKAMKIKSPVVDDNNVEEQQPRKKVKLLAEDDAQPTFVAAAADTDILNRKEASAPVQSIEGTKPEGESSSVMATENVDTPSTTADRADTPIKQSRSINISFGFSDSEDESEED